MASNGTSSKLRSHVDRSSGTTAHGWFPVWFGAIFFAAGALVLGVGLEWIPVDGDSVHAPYWVIATIGAVFAGAGAWMMAVGLRGLLQRRRRRRAAARYPDRPWLADHGWDPAGSWDDAGRGPWRAAAMTAFMVVFLAPFHWWAFGSGEGPWPVKAMVVVFDLLTLLVAWSAVAGWLRRLRYGRPRLRFSRFPFFLGEELDAWLEAPRGMHGARDMTVTLRCVQESYESSGSDDGSRVVARQVHQDEREIELASQGLSRGRLLLPIRFPLPEDAPATELAARPPRYWEIEVRAEAPGLDARSTFLVPVYEAP